MMRILIVVISLILIGFGAKYMGKIADFIKLPSLIGMIVFGMFIGPSFLNIIPSDVLKISPYIKDIALVTVLFVGGLGISLQQMKRIGRPAVCLSIIPAVFEGITIAFLSTKLLKFTFVQGSILGFIIAAVSPAVLVPAMVDLINRKVGEDKAIPQMLLVGASADDTVAITLFTTFIGIYFSTANGESFSLASNLIAIPLTILLSVGIGWILSVIMKTILKNVESEVIRASIAYMVCIVVRMIESQLHIEMFNSLLTIMVYGFFLRTFLKEEAKAIQDKVNVIWNYGKLYLFTFVGMAINPSLVGQYFWIGVLILVISLTVRSIGVLISLIGTDLNIKERIFCVIAYLPKATVQSAKAGVPLQMGIAGGEIMQAIAILSVLITAPIGAIGIKLTSGSFLQQPPSVEEAVI